MSVVGRVLAGQAQKKVPLREQLRGVRGFV